MKCRDCKYFKRGKWHKVVDSQESERFGGSCRVLRDVLFNIGNTDLWKTQTIEVQDTFGCVLFEKQMSKDTEKVIYSDELFLLRKVFEFASDFKKSKSCSEFAKLYPIENVEERLLRAVESLEQYYNDFE